MCVYKGYKVLIMYNKCTVSCQNIYNLFVRGLESDRKRSLWQFLAASARTFYFYQQCTCFLLLPAMFKATAKFCEKSRNKHLSNCGNRMI